MTKFASWNLQLLLYTIVWHPSTSFMIRQFSTIHIAVPLHAQSSYIVKVKYEGNSCDIEVRNSETILDALERSGAANTLSLPEMPSDCRRGNCMTCSAKVTDNHQGLIVTSDDGLSPEISQQLKKNGYVLICSSYVQGDGLSLELGQNHKSWDTVYRQRFENESTRIAARAALARLLRRTAENNIEQWTREVEAILEKSGNEE